MKNKLVVSTILVLLISITLIAVPIIPRMVAAQPSSTGSIVGLWHLDEGIGTTAYDSSGYGNHGTIHGAAWVDGRIGKALGFDGVDDYVEVPDSASLDITDKITVEAWVKINALGTGIIIVRKGLAYSLQKYTDDKFEFWVRIAGSWKGVRTVSGGTVAVKDTWYHVAGVYNGSYVQVYVNNVLDRQAPVTGTIDITNRPLGIGVDTDTTTYKGFFRGIIDEVYVWDTAPPSPPLATVWVDDNFDSSILGWSVYRFDKIQDGVNAVANDGTVHVHDGTYDEQVVINKSLTLQGDSTPIIKPSSAAILTTVLDGRFWGGTRQIAGIIVANAAGASVTVNSIIVDGENIVTKPTGADYVAGIFYRETGGMIDTVTVANMTIGTTGTAVRGYGIYLSAIASAVSIEVKGSTLRNYDKNGIDAHGDKLTVNIHHNTVTGRGPLPNGDEVQNGILIMDGAIGTVDSNTISDMAYIPETWWCAGIMFYSSGCSAASNTVTDTQIGIIFQDASGSAEDNTVAGGAVGLLGLWAQYTEEGTWTISFVGNTISGAKDSSGYENAAIGAQTYDGDASLTVTIDNNQLTGDGSTTADGIYIGDVPAASPAGTITPTIRGNVISGWQNGINLVSSVDACSISNNNITDMYLGIRVQNAMSAQICNNRIIDFVKGGIVTRGTKNIVVEGNIISTTIHDEAPNGIDIGTYSGTEGTIKGNEISGCSWKYFTGDYETSWSGSGILVIESGDSLEIIGNIVHECDVGMDIESDSMNITCNDVHNNIYGFVFWNAKPKVNYNNIYSNTQYGVYRTTWGDLTGALDARYNWWGDPTGPYHATNPSGLGNAVSDYVNFSPWLLTKKVPPLVHDVAITEVVPSAIRVAVGTTIHIKVTAKNEGNTYENFTVTLKYDSNIIGTQTITDMVPGTEKLLTFSWNTIGVAPCHDYTTTAVASTVPGETDTADNTKSAVDKVRIGLAPLMKVEPAMYTAKRLNETFSINITINGLTECWRVIGYQFILTYNATLLEKISVTEGPFFKQFGDTFFIVEQEEGAPVRGDIAIVGGLVLPPWNVFPKGSGTIATITFKAIKQESGLPGTRPPLSVDLKLWDPMNTIPPALIDDTDPECLEIPLNIQHGRYEIGLHNIADINWDYKVNIKDIAIAAKAFGTYPGHPRWNPIADVTGPTVGVPDGKVDIKDIALIAKNFGWVDP